MSDLSKLSEAYKFMITNSLVSIEKNDINNLDDFVQAMEKTVKRISNDFSARNMKRVTGTVNLDYKHKKQIKDMFSNLHINSITYADIICGFINKSDINKQFFSGYIEHITRYIVYTNVSALINNPLLPDLSLTDAMTNPIFIEKDHFRGSKHHYLISDPDNSNCPIPLFSINFDLYLSSINIQQKIPIDQKIELVFSGLVSIDIQNIVNKVIRHLMSIGNTTPCLYNGDLQILHRIDEEFTLSLYLPKAYFRLKR